MYSWYRGKDKTENEVCVFFLCIRCLVKDESVVLIDNYQTVCIEVRKGLLSVKSAYGNLGSLN